MQDLGKEKVGQGYEDEISLHEILLILKKRIRVILLFVILGTSVSLMYVLIAPKVYKSTALISLEINPADVSKDKLRHFAVDSHPLTKNLSFILPFEHRRSHNDIGLAILDSYSFKKEIASLIQRENPHIKIKEREIEKIMTAHLDKKSGFILISSEQKGKMLSRRVLELAIEKLTQQVKSVSQEIYKDDNTIKVIIAAKPTPYEYPVKPKKLLIVMASFVSSLFMGIFGAFFLEWLRNTKQQS